MSDKIFNPAALTPPATVPAPADKIFDPKAPRPGPTQPGTGPVKAWSISTLQQYEKCPYSIYLTKIERVQDEESEPLRRGTALHHISEQYVKAEWESINEESAPYVPIWEEKIYPKFAARFDNLRDLYAEGKVEVEGEWAYGTNWTISEWRDFKTVWCRMKVDVFAFQTETSAFLIDYKSGKRFGNEIKHADQGMTYAVGAFMRYPELEFLETNFWYLDHNEDAPQRYSRAQALQFQPRLHARATAMTSDTVFKPNPSKRNCKFCVGLKTNTCKYAQE